MTVKVLDKYLGRASPEVERDTADSAVMETGEDLGCFGWLRGVRDRAVMLQLRKKSGLVYAVPYAWIENASFDPSDGIVLTERGRAIRIKGRNLNGEARPNLRLFDGITRHRVVWIQEADEPTSLQVSRGATVIDSIEW